jgi:hypothetical protein
MATCPACGAFVRRPEARFCATCGRNLTHTEYIPADTLRSSYHYQRIRPPVSLSDQAYLSTTRGNAPRHRRTQAADTRDRANCYDETRARANTHHRPTPRLSETQYESRARRRAGESHMDVMNESNTASATALALVTYALVPYLGILFCPGAVLMGGVGLLRAQRAPHFGGRRSSLLSIVFGVVILCAQIFLWWILYKVPEWSGRNF